MANDYTDTELRMKALPLAVELVNTEVQRVLQKCNTTTIAEVTGELVNILKYGTVNASTDSVVPDATYEEVKDNTTKFA